MRGSAVEKMDVLVGKILGQLQHHLNYRATSSDAARQIIDDVNGKLGKNSEYIIASLDVCNMYPTLPTCSKALSTVRAYLEANRDKLDLYGFSITHVIWMLGFLLENTYISYNGNHYIQTSGIGTGLHSSGAYADIIIDDLYTNVIQKSSIKPIGNGNYVDDAVVIWPNTRETLDQFKNDLSSVWDSVDFELEVDEGDGIPFLDMLLSKAADGRIKYSFYQKPTNSGKYLHFSSHCSTAIKTNIVRNEAKRVHRACSDKVDVWNHLEKIKSDFTKSGYPMQLIRENILAGLKLAEGSQDTKRSRAETNHILKVPYVSEVHSRVLRTTLKKCGLEDVRLVTTPGTALRSVIKRKTPKECSDETCTLCSAGYPCKASHHVYQMSCNICESSGTGATYIGASRRRPIHRLKEHESSTRLWNDRSSLGLHMIEKHPELEPTAAEKLKLRRKVDMAGFFKKFNPSIIHHGRDTFDVFLNEGLKIREENPSINTMSYNGFIFT